MVVEGNRSASKAKPSSHALGHLCGLTFRVLSMTGQGLTEGTATLRAPGGSASAQKCRPISGQHAQTLSTTNRVGLLNKCKQVCRESSRGQ